MKFYLLGKRQTYHRVLSPHMPFIENVEELCEYKLQIGKEAHNNNILTLAAHHINLVVVAKVILLLLFPLLMLLEDARED